MCDRKNCFHYDDFFEDNCGGGGHLNCNILDQLAEKHTAMRVDHSGILGRIAGGCKVRPDQRYILGEMDKHLVEMAKRFYDGDIRAVDEFLQLYCLDDHRPEDKERYENKS